MDQRQRNKRNRGGKEKRQRGRQSRKSGAPIQSQAPVVEPVPGVVMEPGKLPESYDQTRVVVLPIHPYLVHVYWEVAPGDVEKDRQRLPEADRAPQACLRFYDITYIDFDGTNAHGWFDVDIELGAENWYVELWSANKSYCVDLGLRSAAGDFLPLARSNIVQTAPDQPSVNIQERYSFLPRENRGEQVQQRRQPFDLPGEEEESVLPGESRDWEASRTVEFSQGTAEGAAPRPPRHRSLTAQPGRGSDWNDQGKPPTSSLRSFGSINMTEIVRQHYRKLPKLQTRSMTPSAAPSTVSYQDARQSLLTPPEPETADITQINERAFAFGVSSRPTSR